MTPPRSKSVSGSESEAPEKEEKLGRAARTRANVRYHLPNFILLLSGSSG